MTAEARAPGTILVPIDLHGVNRRSLETLVRIARQLDQGLLGLLLEDLRLQQVADLPFTTEITLSGGRERSLLRDHLTQRHSLVSSDTRRLLNELAARDRVELSFEDASGARWRTVLEREDHQDIFFPARQRPYSTAVAYPATSNIIPRLGLVLAPNQACDKVIGTAAALVTSGLVGDVYVLSRRPPLPEQLHALYRPGHQVRLHPNFSCDAEAVAALLRQSPYDLLLLPRKCLQGIAPEALEAALDKSGGQVLVIN